MGVTFIKKSITADCLVTSDSVKGAFYLVNIDEDEAVCTCPDHKTRNRDCKHIKEAREELFEEGYD